MSCAAAGQSSGPTGWEFLTALAPPVGAAARRQPRGRRFPVGRPGPPAREASRQGHHIGPGTLRTKLRGAIPYGRRAVRAAERGNHDQAADRHCGQH